MAARFSAPPGSREARWVTFIDLIQTAYPANTAIQDAIQTIAAGKITTLGRLYSDPNFREHVGLEEDENDLLSHYPATELEPVLERVVTDLAGELSVTKIKSKEQRAAYLAGLPTPKTNSYQAQLIPFGSNTGTRPAPRATTTRRTRPASPFKDLDLRALDQRIDDIVRELRKLDLERFPNAAAVLTRVLLELSLDQFVAKKSLRLTKQNPKLRDKLMACLHAIDPTDKDGKYQAVRAGLADGTSIYAVSTLHGYIHNQFFHPTATEVRAIVANLKPFLQALSDGV